MSKPWDAYQQAPQGQPVPPDGPWSQYQQAPSDVPAEDAMPASESEPARTWLGKMLGVSRNTEAGLPLTIHQGLTFGYGDEINAAAAGLGEYLGFHPGYGYDEALAEQRKQIADYKLHVGENYTSLKRFEGFEDHTFGEYTHTGDDYQNPDDQRLAPIRWEVATEHSRMTVMGIYDSREGLWLVGVLGPVPEHWSVWMENGTYTYTPALVIDAPADVAIRCLERAA
mgnify:CR=1 FL=1